MPSPFPGMNPYLEHDDPWHDFHEAFIGRMPDSIEVQVGEAYIAKTDRNIYVHEVPEQNGLFIGWSDVSVANQRDPISAASGAKSLAPVVGQFLTEDIEEDNFIEIRDRQRRQVVTVIELLSPTNKRPGENRDAYISKRRAILKSAAHFVEIDLLRGGPRMPLKKPIECQYCVMVSRYEDRPQTGLWPLTLRDRLPRIPVPLRAPDPDIFLDLQDLLNQVYDAAGFRKYVYSHDPDPPLPAEDATWAKQFMVANSGSSVHPSKS